jgi:internalin A
MEYARKDNHLICNDFDIEKVFEGHIDKDYLEKNFRKDLSELESITLTVDLSYQSIHNVAELLPNLKTLTLDNSIVPCVRDLGTGFRCLSSLSLNNCGIFDLDGISVLSALKSLSLKGNQISDVSPLATHENIEVKYVPSPQLLN